jgi:hypothetical protein
MVVRKLVELAKQHPKPKLGVNAAQFTPIQALIFRQSWDRESEILDCRTVPEGDGRCSQLFSEGTVTNASYGLRADSLENVEQVY